MNIEAGTTEEHNYLIDRENRKMMLCGLQARPKDSTESS